MTSAVKKMQEKLFRRGESTPSPEPQQQSDRAEPGLTINIPNKIPFPMAQAQPPPKLKPVDGTPKASAEALHSKSYRQRLANASGAAYKGAEKHRLQQDDAREKHWKRWGPYLSDRQWVRTRYHKLCAGRHTADLLFSLLCMLIIERLLLRRLRSARTIRQMEMPGAISLTNMRDHAHIGGAKMVWRAFPTTISVCVLDYRCGTMWTRS